MKLVFDIETAPLDEANDYLEPAEAPSNYKDPAKIAAFIAEKNAENLDRCGLDVDLCRVVAIGFLLEDGHAPIALVGGDERELLSLFWRAAEGRHLVGFNCLAFDLPVLLRRSLYLGVPTPGIQIDKYRHPDVTDLQMVLSFNGSHRLRGLSFYARRFGIDVPDPMTGAGIARAVREGRWDDVKSHVVADVRKTALLAERCGAFGPMKASEAAAF